MGHKTWLRSTTGTLLLVGCLLASSACSSTDKPKAEGPDSGNLSDSSAANVPFQADGDPVNGGTLKISSVLAPTAFAAMGVQGQGDILASMQVFDGLVAATADPSKIAPALADTWAISPDGLTYTFHLRPGVKFSNGDALTAEDVKFSLEKAIDPEADPLFSSLFSSVKSITVTDPATVELKLSQVTPALLAALTTAGGLIVSESAHTSLGATEFGFTPVGTGPFMVTKFSAGNPTIELKRNPNYWQAGLPHLDGVTYTNVPDDNTRMLAVKSGQADVGDQVPFAAAAGINSGDVKLFKQNQFCSDWILVNGFDGPLSKVAVRRALVFATPLDQIVKTAFHGLTIAAATASHQTKYLDPNLKPLPYDIDKAKSLLAEAGVSDLTLTLGITSGDSVGKQVATILQASWAEAGVELKVEEKDAGALNSDRSAQNFQLQMLPPSTLTSDISVDDQWAQYLTADPKPGDLPYTGWDNAEAQRLVTEATSTLDEDVRTKNFHAYQQILSDEQPVIAVAYVPNLFALRTNVHNFVATGSGWPLLRDVWLSK